VVERSWWFDRPSFNHRYNAVVPSFAHDGVDSPMSFSRGVRGEALQQQRNSLAEPKMNLLVPATPGCELCIAVAKPRNNPQERQPLKQMLRPVDGPIR
jgi:hypothetical protein